MFAVPHLFYRQLLLMWPLARERTMPPPLAAPLKRMSTETRRRSHNVNIGM